MTTPFSWSDTAQIALGSCMPCLRPVPSSDNLQNTNRPTVSGEQPEPYNPAVNRIPRARPDELQGLLADSSDNERAETLSLHSNPGRGGRRRKRRSKANANANGKPRRITLFGFDLFGRPPPIQLPPDDDADDDAPLFRRHHSSSSGGGSTPTTTLTTQTFDSDAAPLDISTIKSISVSKATEAAEAEAKRLQEKEERRQQRKARKEMKRLVEAGVVGDGEEFEGFQGSGGLALLKRPSGAGAGGETTATSSSGSHSRSHSRSQQSREGFGNFVSAPLPPPTAAAAEEDDENADLDGSLYARKKSTSVTHHSNGETSDSRRNRSSLSRTSASASDRAQHLQSIPNPAVPNLNRPKSKSKHSSTSQSRSRSNTSSQSPSIQSPSSPAFSDAQVVSPSTVEQGQGFFDLEDELPVREGAFTGRIGGGDGGGFPVGRIGGGGFPMTGFGGGGGKRSRDFGAFLARRGDGEESRVGDGGGDGV